jgi:hypothetical protein
MFKNKQFYHQHVKRAIVAFGMIFNNININRVDGSGITQQVMRVPLAYSTKQKFLSRIRSVTDTESRGEVAINLPRMGFEITSLDYDSTRKISPIQKNKVTNNSSLNVTRTYVSTPYNMSLSLYVFAKNQEDGLQIIEQILPFFNPDFNVTVNELPELNIKRDIKITLDNIGYDDLYEGPFAERQSIMWTLNFTMRLNFFGFVSNENIIKEAIVKTYDDTDSSNIKSYSQITASVATTNATATAVTDGDAITNVLIDHIGSGYINAPNITISGGGGSGATAVATIEDGSINTITVTAGGTGYTTAPTVTIEAPPDIVDPPGPDDPFRFVLEFENVIED